MTETRIGNRAAAVVCFGLSLLYFLPALMPGRMLFGTDYLGSGFVFYEEIQTALRAGELPAWAPGIYGGVPLFANPGSTFHPVHLLLSLLLPLSKVFPLLFAFQFGLAGFGTYRLARELEVRGEAALVAGLLFELTGVTASWVYAGHDGRIIVATTAPLVLALLLRGVQRGSLGAFAGASLALGAALLSFQIQNAWYLLLGSGLLVAAAILRPGVEARAKKASLAALSVALAFALAAVNFLPFWTYVKESPRAEGRLGEDFAVAFSASPSDLAGAVLPEWPGATATDPTNGEPLLPPYRGSNPLKLHTEYLGALVPLLAVAGLFFARRRFWFLFFAAQAGFFTTLALGGHTPLYRLYLATLPLLSRFRAPDLAYFMVALSLCVMAGLALEGWLSSQRETRAPVLFVALLSGAALIAAAIFWTEPWAVGAVRFAVVAGLSAVALGLRRRLSVPTLCALLAVVGVLDLLSVGRRFLFVIDGPEAPLGGDAVTAFLSPRREEGRAWVLSVPEPWRGGGAFAMRHGIDQLGGEHSLPIQRYLDLYSPKALIADPERVETPNGPALTFREATWVLDAASVRFVVSTVPLAMESYRLALASPDGFVYERPAPLPRAFLVGRVEGETDGSLSRMRTPKWDARTLAFAKGHPDVHGPSPRGAARVTKRERRALVVSVESDDPGFLVVTENQLDGWTATLDGKPTPVFVTNRAFRGVDVPAGRHEVRFSFSPPGQTAGVAVSLCSAALLSAALAVARRRARRAAG